MIQKHYSSIISLFVRESLSVRFCMHLWRIVYSATSHHLKKFSDYMMNLLEVYCSQYLVAKTRAKYLFLGTKSLFQVLDNQGFVLSSKNKAPGCCFEINKDLSLYFALNRDLVVSQNKAQMSKQQPRLLFNVQFLFSRSNQVAILI